LRSLQEIQSDFVEEAKAYAELWSQGKKKKKTTKNNHVRYLDLNITYNQDALQRDTLRKPTSCDIIINKDSKHSDEHKMAAIRSMSIG